MLKQLRKIELFLNKQLEEGEITAHVYFTMMQQVNAELNKLPREEFIKEKYAA